MYPQAFYRVSVKALVKDDKGAILVLKENQDTWSLPGGGLEHGKDPLTALRRELQEELGITQADIMASATVKTFLLEHRAAWLLWLVYEVTIPAQDFTLGPGVTEACYIDPAKLASSEDIFEKMVYETAMLQTKEEL